MTVTLIGQTAAGKTYLGRDLERKLPNHQYKDLDHEVEKFMGMPISEMYKNHTEEELKKYFKEVYYKLVNTPNTIIGTGGFFAVYFDFEDTENIFYLNISKEIFVERIIHAKNNSHLKENKNRRIIHHKDISEVHDHYDSRVGIYEDKCTHKFDILTNKDVDKLTKEVLNTMKKINNDLSADNIEVSGQSPTR